MKTRLSYQVEYKELARKPSLEQALSNEEPTNPGYFKCLKGRDVITAEVSDHHPIIHDGVLFWNIMMQCKKRNGHTGMSYNNGFGIIENDEKYINRLMKVAGVIAEIMYLYPSIDVINLCEGPIESLHVKTLLQALKKYQSMDKFFIGSVVQDTFHKPNIEGFPNWGLLMLANKKYKINKVKWNFMDHSVIFNKLANRFQIWQLTDNKEKSIFIALGHFPFGGDEKTTQNHQLSLLGNMYCNLVKKMMNDYEQLILCADFNLNPNLISKWQDRAMDLIINNNSILLTTQERTNKVTIEAVTVDGILLSAGEKQKYYRARFNFGLFSTLKKEDRLFQSSVKEHLTQNRHENFKAQRTYDQQYGLVLK
jgi:hypothetical protein